MGGPIRIYEREIVSDYALWLIEMIIEKNPIMKQSADIALENRKTVELKFSIN